MVTKKTTKKTASPKNAPQNNVLTRGHDECCDHSSPKASCNTIYSIGLIGAGVYFIQHATSFWSIVLGILQALVWPAILVYKTLEFLIK